MATKSTPSKEPKVPKRANRTVNIAEALTGALDPALRRRGFASRDIITHWAAIAPSPYDKIAMPDKLAWPRGERSAEGATLTLRCVAGHALMLSHEAPKIAAAVNRYFGYVLVAQVRLSPAPFMPRSAAKTQVRSEPSAAQRAKVETALTGVSDDGVKAALHRLGAAIIGKNSE